MMRNFILLIILSFIPAVCTAQKVTVDAVDQPAASVFRSLIEQTGKNFVYSSELLEGLNVTVQAKNKPLKKVLDKMFAGTGITYKINGRNVVLKRKYSSMATVSGNRSIATVSDTTKSTMLQEIVVVSRLEAPAVETAEIGAKKITPEELRNAPALFGEADVIKTLQLQPGVTDGTEGIAGMYVHGGNSDENLYMLDNVPLYQVNHFAGLFSAFNTDIIRYLDFYKSSVPAKFDGRLSSFMDVRLQNGNRSGHHGSARLGLTSGAFNISGPIGSKTTYLIGIRRSWYDVLSVPILAIINSKHEEQVRFHYYFMDLNAKVTHRFSNKATGFVSVYFGDDFLKTGYKDKGFDSNDFLGGLEDERYNFHWGNLVAQGGLNYRLTSDITAEFTAAYTRSFSSLTHHDYYKDSDGKNVWMSENHSKTKNNNNDWIFRGDFDWKANDNSTVRFGANYVRHSFLPARTSRKAVADNVTIESQDSTWAYGANELNAYIEDDWRINDKWHINAGFHASLFNIDGKVKYGLSPRLSAGFRPAKDIALKAAYTRTTQYVHQLTQSNLSLPTDQWVPVTGNFKPATADKIAVGAYWQTTDKTYAISVEGYFKWMHNLMEYRDEYYLRPPLEMWNARLTSGRGTAKGIDFKFEKLFGKVTGHVAYSLAWADRTFAEKNGGRTYPARFDNRHTIKVLVNWAVSKKVELNALWVGHSGNRYTLMPQSWEIPPYCNISYYDDEAALQTNINNYQLPFYHRLDLSCKVRNSRGYWTFSLYNAYNHMNVIAVNRGTKSVVVSTPNEWYMKEVPTFQKFKLLPIIPSISYTWQF